MIVFKTPHCENTTDLDSSMKLVDACLASSAAPIYRSLAAVHARGVQHIFADGGLVANNPILIGLIDALDLADQRDKEIELYSLGTCAPVEGAILEEKDRGRGFIGWSMGAEVVSVSLAAQVKATDDIVHLLSGRFRRSIKIIRFPEPEINGNYAQHLRLDQAENNSLEIMEQLAGIAAETTAKEIRRCSVMGNSVQTLFNSMPPMATPRKEV